MRVELVESAVGGDRENHYLTSLLVDRGLAVDMGGLGFCGDLARQQAVRDVFLTHAHLDHVASLPFFLENVYRSADRPVRLHASRPVLDSLARHLFNGEIWPDLFALEGFCECVAIAAETPVRAGDLEVIPVEVAHPVPTFGYVVASESAAVVIAPDTGPTARLWEVANRLPQLKAVFLDLSFPEALAELAEVSQHLTPARFAAEIAKLERPVPVHAIHLKARFRADIARELAGLGLDGVTIARPGVSYEF